MWEKERNGIWCPYLPAIWKKVKDKYVFFEMVPILENLMIIFVIKGFSSILKFSSLKTLKQTSISGFCLKSTKKITAYDDLSISPALPSGSEAASQDVIICNLAIWGVLTTPPSHPFLNSKIGVNCLKVFGKIFEITPLSTWLKAIFVQLTCSEWVIARCACAFTWKILFLRGFKGII